MFNLKYSQFHMHMLYFFYSKLGNAEFDKEKE